MNKKLKVLILEDLPSDAELAKIELNKVLKDNTIKVVDNEKGYVEALNTFGPDLIVSDYMLPSFNGLSALKIKKDITPYVPFVLLTGSINEETAVECIKAGADDYVIKEHIKRLGSAALGAIKKKKTEFERKQAAKEILESEKKFRTLVTNIPGITYRCDCESNWTMRFLSDKIEDLLGYPATELIANKVRTYASIIYPDDRKMVEETVFDAIGKKEPFSIEYRIIHANGDLRWVSEKGIGVFGNKNNVLYLDGVIFDITERKRIEENLKISEERLKILFDSAPDAYFLSDIYGTFTNGNRAAEELVGYKKEELIGKNYLKLKLLSTKEMLRAAKLLLKNIQGKGTGPDEFILNRQDGSQVTVEILTHPVKVQNKTVVLGIARDISERKIAEKKLKDSEKKHRFYVESAPDGIFIANARGNYVDVNPAACQMTGYSREELLDMSIPDLASPEALPEDLASFDELKKFKENQSEVLLRRKNGTDFPAFLTSVALSEDRFMAFCSDITDRKQAEETLKENEEKLTQAQKIAKTGHYNLSFKTGLWRSSTELDNIFGIDKNFKRDINGSLKIIHPDFGGIVANYLRDQIINKRPKFEQEFKIVNFKTKQEKWVNGLGEFKLDKNNRVIEIFGTVQDITERKNAEEALKENEEKFRSLVNNSPNIVMRIDSEGVINYINYEYSNQKPEDIIGQTIYKFIPAEFYEVARSTIEQVFETGESNSFENLGIGNADKVLWYRNNIAAIKNGKVTAATVIITDITEQKQTEIIQKEFIASISHELRTPLTTIRESLSLLSDNLFGELNSDQLDIVNPCMEDVDRLGRILNNLLAISNIEGKKINLERKMIDIVGLARSTVSSFEQQATSKSIELLFTPNQTSIELYIDRDRIIQVLMNLIGNAMKFTEKGKIEVLITERKDKVECCIKDTGRGIEQNDLGTLFDRLHQVGKIMRTGEKGSGLGLSVVKGIVKSHKGKVWVNSEIKKGSKFFFSLPKYGPDKIIIENIENEIKKLSGKHIKRSLLLVRLNNFLDIETKFDVDQADKVTKLMHQIIQDELAPGEFSFIKAKDEVILFSDVPKQNINILTSKLEDMLTEFVPKINKDITADLSYSCSIYPEDGESTDELMQKAYKELLSNDKD